MAWHLPYRPTHLHYAVSTALLCSIGTAILLPTAKAATVGKTTITSSQHEPLVAIISIADIKASDFSANLANPVVYQQLGLTPTASMSVSFVPTSASTGQVMISTSQPFSKPFADVVLAINDNGQRNVIPKTLLMPLGASSPSKQASRPNRTVASATKPNLPVTSARVAPAASNIKPLAVKRGVPPPLFEQPNLAPALPNIPNPKSGSSMSVIRVATAPNLPVAPAAAPSSTSSSPSLDMTTNNVASIANTKTLDIKNNRRVSSRSDSELSTDELSTDDLDGNDINRANNTLNNSANVVPPTPISNAANEVLTETQSPPVPASSATNVQQDLLSQSKANSSAINDNSKLSGSASDNRTLDNSTLNIEVTRQIIVRNSPINKVNSTNSPTLALNFDENIASLNAANYTNLDKKTPDRVANEQADDLSGLADSSTANNATADASTTNASASSDAVQTDSAQIINYTVQRNDNLWIISKQIAEQNDLDISAVMSQIKSQNPDAFINQDANQLKADAKLRLPNYEVVPSENSIKGAIAAQRKRYLQANKAVDDKTSEKAATAPLDAADNKTKTAAAKKKSTSKSSESTDIVPKTTTPTLPQARFSVVAPGRKGKADGTQTKSASATGSGLDTKVLSSLKSSRQRTAAQAQRVKSTSNSLGSYTQKLQLQNEKLAELEARLKKLRNQ